MGHESFLRVSYNDQFEVIILWRQDGNTSNCATEATAKARPFLCCSRDHTAVTFSARAVPPVCRGCVAIEEFDSVVWEGAPLKPSSPAPAQPFPHHSQLPEEHPRRTALERPSGPPKLEPLPHAPVVERIRFRSKKPLVKKAVRKLDVCEKYDVKEVVHRKSVRKVEQNVPLFTMFYSSVVLTRKGPLSRIWIAAHLQNRLTKAMVFATDVSKAVDKIIQPEAPMALRLTSNLLLGVVRIFSRKAKYLLQESSEAMAKMKLTFRVGASAALDLPPDENNANFNAITLDTDIDHPTRAPLLDLDLIPRSERKSIDRSQTSSYLAAERDITIDEFAGGLSGGMIDNFALEPELLRGGDMDVEMEEPLAFTPSQRTPAKSSASPAISSVLSKPGSVEIMRDAPRDAPQGAITPILRPTDKPDVEHELMEEDPFIQPRYDTPVDDAVVERDAALDNLTPAERISLDVTDPASPLARDARLSTGGDELMVIDEEEPSASAKPEAPSSPATGATPPATAEPGVASTAAEAAEEAAPAAPAGRGRKRRAFMRVDEEKTEITAAEFRANLADTSDLIRRPRTRRRLNTDDRRRGGQLANMRPEELLAQPVIAMPPELNELFSEWFDVDAMLKRVASPMSEAGRAEEGLKKIEAEAEESSARASLERDPASRATPERTLVPHGEGTPSEQEKSAAALSEGGPMSGRQSMSVAGEMLSPLRLSTEEYLPPQIELLEPEAGAFATPGAPQRVADEGDVDSTPGPGTTEGPESPGVKLRDVAMTRVEVKMSGGIEEIDTGESETLSKRAVKMHQFISEHLSEEGSLNLSAALSQERNITRRTAARSFYEVLNLCSRKVVTLEQSAPYGDIIATPLQPGFDAVRT